MKWQYESDPHALESLLQANVPQKLSLMLCFTATEQLLHRQTRMHTHTHTHVLDADMHTPAPTFHKASADGQLKVICSVVIDPKACVSINPDAHTHTVHTHMEGRASKSTYIHIQK